MPKVMRLNKIGSFSMATMGQSKNVMMDFMKKNKPGGTSFQDSMLKLVRTLPKVLKFLPGDKAKDARAFMMSLQYWLGGSPENIEALLLNLANGYVGEISEGNLLGELEVRAALPAGTSAEACRRRGASTPGHPPPAHPRRPSRPLPGEGARRDPRPGDPTRWRRGSSRPVEHMDWLKNEHAPALGIDADNAPIIGITLQKSHINTKDDAPASPRDGA